jgi:murein DD-endopeptidase MepM/ murein hydrolase activator NlpD
MHRGLDIGALYGSAVRAPANGKVLFATRQAAYGNLIVLDHGGGVSTRYGHLSRFVVKAGERVRQGDLIGYVGSTGRSTGPHLHYEVRLDERTVNPRNYLPISRPIAD